MNPSSHNVGRLIQAQIYRSGVFGRRPVVPVEPEALAAAARRRMSPQAWAYVAGSAGQQRTAQANLDAFADHRIVPRMLVDTAERDVSTTLFGHRLRAPVMFAPVGVLELVHSEADLAVARAARTVALPMVVSTQASTPMEDIATELGESPRWYQLYWSANDDLARSFVERAEAIGSQAIVVTLDTHVLGWRTRDLDQAYLPFARGLGIAQYTSDPVFTALLDQRPPSDEPTPRPTPAAVAALVQMTRSYPGPFLTNLRSPRPRAAVDTFLEVFSRSSLTWADLARLRDWTSLPIVVKGIQDPRDAALALDHGVDGIVVSNHGGRQVDGAVGSLAMLPRVVDEVAGRVPVLFDSGIRSGADAFVALALGAAAVLVGRPYVYGLTLAGAEGAAAVMEHILAELDITMALSGVSRIDQIDRDLVLSR